MIDLKQIIDEDNKINHEYEDEKLLSNIVDVSLVKPLRAIANMGSKDKDESIKLNAWLEKVSIKAKETEVLNFDKIKDKVDTNRKSCDMLFIKQTVEDDTIHLLGECKCVSKRELIKYLSMDEKDNDGILLKVKDSVLLLKNEIQIDSLGIKNDDFLSRLHFFVVYDGKNNVASYKPLRGLRKTLVKKDNNKKQNKASKNIFCDKNKNESENETILDRNELDSVINFGKKVVDEYGLYPCNEESFPGKALPKVKKEKGKGKIRSISLFSVKDFAEVIDNGFFEQYKLKL